LCPSIRGERMRRDASPWSDLSKHSAVASASCRTLIAEVQRPADKMQAAGVDVHIAQGDSAGDVDGLSQQVVHIVVGQRNRITVQLVAVEA